MAKKANEAGLTVDHELSNMSVTLTVKNPDKTLGKSRTFCVLDLSKEISDTILLKGCAAILQQRVSDVKTGANDRLEAMSIVWDMWLSGDYKAERKGGKRTTPAIIQVLFQAALAKNPNATLNKVEAAWAKLDEEAQAKYREKFAEEIKAFEEARQEEEAEDMESLIGE